MHLRVYVENLEDGGRKSIVGHVRRTSAGVEMETVLQDSGRELLESASALLGVGLAAAKEVGEADVRERLDQIRVAA